HHHQADTKGRGLLDQQIPVLAAGGIENEQATRGQQQQQQQQHAIDVQALQQAGAAAQDVLVGEVAVEIAVHRAASGERTGSLKRYSGLSCPSGPSSQASITCLTTGAATPEPDSPFSTITATAIRGLPAGAKATNSAWSRCRS